MKFIVYVILSYIFGSIPFGIIIGRLFKGIDIRKFGSGNIGAANAFRALGFWGGLTVLLTDMSKGFIPVILAKYFVSGDLVYLLQVVSGIFSIIGHNYSIFLKFKGGKGIATSFGVLIALNWKIAFICFGIWALMVFITKYSSVGSLSGSLALPILMAVLKQPLPYTIFGLICCFFAFHAHRGNIKKLIEGKELKITDKGKDPPGEGSEPEGKNSDKPEENTDPVEKETNNNQNRD